MMSYLKFFFARLWVFLLIYQLMSLTLSAAPRSAVIVEENRREGSSDWMLTKVEPASGTDSVALCERRPAIEAYCSHSSIRAGERLSVFVSTNPPSEYRAEIFRMGYYGGKGGRLMKSLGPLAGTAQPMPADGAGKVVECRWEEGFGFEIPTDWVSGVYLGKLTAVGSGFQSYFVFIVRDERQADYLFQCSDLTWQSYNRWPAWSSLYDLGKKHWVGDGGNDISFDRPYTIFYNPLPSRPNPLTNGSGEFLLWEQPLCFWMEKEGYDVTYISNLDTHQDAPGLLRAKGFLSVGHDEYWTQSMVDNVAAARDAGVSLAFLSGNSVGGRIELKASSDGRAGRIFRRLKVGESDNFTDEQELMGASSYGVGAADWTCRKPGHWMFSGTGMKAGDTIPQLVGWEYHGPPLRKDPSLVVLASGKILFKGKLSERTYAATLYDGPRGNFVFNAATCWWSQLLSRPPGAVNPPGTDFGKPDARVQQITKNLLSRMVEGAATE